MLSGSTVAPHCHLIMPRAEHGSVGELLHTPSVRTLSTALQVLILTLPLPLPLTITITLTLPLTLSLSTALQVLILRDAARGMAHLHAHATRHCNLRAANLVVFDPFVVKVSDAPPST